MKVCKFGGSSLADAAAIRHALSVLRREPAARRWAVVSAPGKRSPRDTKITDHLLAAHDAAASGSMAAFEAACDPIRARQNARQNGSALICLDLATF